MHGGWGVDEPWMAESEPGGHRDRSSLWGTVAEFSCLGVKAYAGPQSAFWNLFSLQSPGQATRDFPGDGDMQEPRGGIRKVSPLPRPLWPCPSVQMFRTSVPQTPPTPRGYYPQRLLPLGHSTVQAGFTRRIHGTFGLESFLPLT